MVKENSSEREVTSKKRRKGVTNVPSSSTSVKVPEGDIYKVWQVN